MKRVFAEKLNFNFWLKLNSPEIQEQTLLVELSHENKELGKTSLGQGVRNSQISHHTFYVN